LATRDPDLVAAGAQPGAAVHDATESDFEGIVAIYNEVIANSTAAFGSFSDFRAWPGYRFTVEHTLHVRADARGRGIGTQLLRALIERAAALGKHVMIAGVDADNAASIRLHERLGFTRAGQLCEVGFKFDRWLDLLFLQRSI
jgi:L-amino acid N-acyltransferase